MTDSWEIQAGGRQIKLLTKSHFESNVLHSNVNRRKMEVMGMTQDKPATVSQCGVLNRYKAWCGGKLGLYRNMGNLSADRHQ